MVVARKVQAFRGRCRFELSLRYELFYSLASLLDPASRLHDGWRVAMRSALGPAVGTAGGAPALWLAVPATLPGAMASPTFEEIVAGLRALPIRRFQEKILIGLLHSEAVVSALLSGKTTPSKAIAKAPRIKHDWLQHIGLYPFQEDRPMAVSLTRLLSDPEDLRAELLRALGRYWRGGFRDEWRRLRPQYLRSLEEKERLFRACSLDEFARHALLRVAVDEAKGRLGAVRGGYTLPLADVEACFFLPSAFNDGRFWSSFCDDDGKTYVYFPYFDPSIELAAAGERPPSEPEIDPALVFRALGDTTRFALASLLARAPRTSVEIANALSIAKPTVSHHVQVLRAAGLLRETHVGGTIELALRRDVLEGLSDATIRTLFDGTGTVDVRTTRTRV